MVALEGAARADVAKEDELRPLADVPDEVVIEIGHIGEVALLHVRDHLEENLLGAVHKEAVARSRRILLDKMSVFFSSFVFFRVQLDSRPKF